MQRSPSVRPDRLVTPGFGESRDSGLFPLRIEFGERADSEYWREMEGEDCEIFVRRDGALRPARRLRRDVPLSGRERSSVDLEGVVTTPFVSGVGECEEALAPSAVPSDDRKLRESVEDAHVDQMRRESAGVGREFFPERRRISVFRLW